MAPKPIIAVIEDDPASAEALGFILADWGAEVAFDTAAEALAQRLGPRVGEIAVVITDFNLGPGVNGVIGARTLRALAPSARVLVLSGTMRGRGAAAAKAAGFDFMAKPARPEAIVAWLDRT